MRHIPRRATLFFLLAIALPGLSLAAAQTTQPASAPADQPAKMSPWLKGLLRTAAGDNVNKAVNALHKLQETTPKNQAAIPELIQIFKMHKSVYVRLNAAYTLGRFGPAAKTAKDALQEALKKVDAKKDFKQSMLKGIIQQALLRIDGKDPSLKLFNAPDTYYGYRTITLHRGKSPRAKLSIYDAKGKFLFSTPDWRGRHGSFQPKWFELEGALRERLIGDQPMCQAILNMHHAIDLTRETTIVQPENIHLAEIKTLKAKLQKLLGPKWTIDIRPNAQGFKPQRGDGRGMEIICRNPSVKFKRKAMSGGMEEVSAWFILNLVPRTSDYPKLVTLQGPYTCFVGQSERYRAYVSNRALPKTMDWRKLNYELCNLLDLNWGLTENGLRLQTLNEDSKNPGMKLRCQIQNLNDHPVVFFTGQPGQWFVEINGGYSCDPPKNQKEKPKARDLHPGYRDSLLLDISQWTIRDTGKTIAKSPEAKWATVSFKPYPIPILKPSSEFKSSDYAPPAKSVSLSSPMLRIRPPAETPASAPADQPAKMSQEVKIIVFQLGSDNPKEVVKALYKLADLGPEAHPAIPTLIEVFKTHESEYVRAIAAYAIGRFGPAAKSAKPVLQAALKQPKLNSDIRTTVREAIQRINGEDPLLPLIRKKKTYIGYSCHESLSGFLRGPYAFLTVYDQDGKKIISIRGERCTHFLPYWFEFQGEMTERYVGGQGGQLDFHAKQTFKKTNVKRIIQPENIHMAEIARLKTRLQKALGPNWKIKIDSEDYGFKPRPGDGRGIIIVGGNNSIKFMREDEKTGKENKTTASFMLCLVPQTSKPSVIFGHETAPSFLGQSNAYRVYAAYIYMPTENDKQSIENELLDVLGAKWSQTQNGLRFMATNIKGPAGPTVRACLQNVSDKPIRIFLNREDTWRAVWSDGTRCRPMAPKACSKINFRILQPGEKYSESFALSGWKASKTGETDPSLPRSGWFRVYFKPYAVTLKPDDPELKSLRVGPVHPQPIRPEPIEPARPPRNQAAAPTPNMPEAAPKITPPKKSITLISLPIHIAPAKKIPVGQSVK